MPTVVLRCLLWLLFLAGFLLLPGVVLAANLEYRIEGLDKTQRNNVRAWLGEAPNSVAERSAFVTTVRDRVEKGLQALGYYDPDIDFTLDKSVEPWQLTITATAGEPVHLDDYDLQLLGDAAADPAFTDYLAKAPLQPGDQLNHDSYEAMKKALLDMAQRRGYFDARLTRKRVEVEVAANSARLILHFDSGPRYRFGRLLHDGQYLTDEQLAALQTFNRGDPFELARLQEFQSQLQRTGYFSGVLVRPQIDAVEGLEIPLALDLSSAKRHSFEVGVGYSTDTRERVSLVWRTPHVNRWGHSQETRLEYSKINPSGRVTYNIPLTHPLDDVLQLRARLEQNEYGDIDSHQTEFGVRRELRRDNWIYGISLRQLNERWDVASLSQDDDYLLPGISLAHKYRVGPLVNPSRGLSQFYQLEGGSDQAGSDIDLVRAYSKLVYVHALAGTPHRLVGRLEAGVVFVSDSQRDQLAPSLSFFAGGSQSLRGYSYQSVGEEVKVTRNDGTTNTLTVGGDRLLVGSLEYQYRFLPDWRAAVFVDAGDAFNAEDFSPNYGVGAGVHYLTPVGAVKLEVANSVSEDDPSWRVHINIGAEF
ncbi:outer membrane protein assembly factor [Parahaliea maris]|uniref:Translocation and assembly module subunit TamA n=1 Tax=Parahaliea maris TaxID=2716870 RepID=A0A5C9A6I4_9GAMM|nr:autotransporter assembly complex family protein [Parahaliea maris]TXS95659.1 outer membrane protein assembly factor [Parahaliea maris]